MKKNSLKCITLIFSLILISLSTATYAWLFANNRIDDQNGGGTTLASYFESGSGSKEDPYIISNVRHFYNLAWLQYLGYFNQDADSDGVIDKQYYFQLKNDIDCNELVIPPIGTTEYPFLGSFDGMNYTISNYVISDVYNKFTSHPSAIDETGNKYHTSQSETINYCSIIGTFGVVGSYNGEPKDAFYDSSVVSLKNFYLDDVTISTKTSNLLVGCIAGYVNSTINNCGVHYVKFDIAGNTSKLSSFDNVSNFTLIGSYNKEKYKWDQDPDGSGDDNAYGTSTDFKELYELLGSKDGNTIEKDNAYPFRPENQDIITSTNSYKMDAVKNTLKVTVSGTYQGTSHQKASTKGNNLGYYVGSGIKTYYRKDMNFDDVYKYNGIGGSPITLEEKIYKYLTDERVDENGNTYINGNYCIRLTGESDNAFSKWDSFSVVEDAQVGTWVGRKSSNESDETKKPLIIPNRSIWVAPKEAGKFKFLTYNPENTAAGIRIMYLKRSVPFDYSSPFLYSGSTYSYVQDITIPAKKMTYFEIPVSEEDINNGQEYAISYYQGNSLKGPYIVYMDIGVNGGDTPSDDRLALSDFDFVTKENNSLVKIKTYDSTQQAYVSNSAYSKSNVTFKIGETSNNTILAFRRLSDENGGVLYYQLFNIITPSSTGTKTSSNKEDCTS